MELSCFKKISIIKTVTLKHHSDFYCINCINTFATKNKLEYRRKVCKKNFVELLCQLKKNNILEFSQYIESDKMPYIIYADIESLIKKIGDCNPEKSLTTKIVKDILCEYSMSTIWTFDHIDNKHSLYRGKDCMKNFCESLRKHANRKNGIKCCF